MSRALCHCGHSKDSHYLDKSVLPHVLVSCLCTGCDCPSYADEDGPAPVKKVERPNHTKTCRCYRCRQWWDQQPKHYRQTHGYETENEAEENAPSTLRTFPAAPVDPDMGNPYDANDPFYKRHLP